MTIGAVVFLFPHSIDTLGTRDTQDRSWIWALYRSWRHLTFGRDIDFSYGPYGFLEYPSSGVSRGLWLVAALLGFFAVLALCILTFALVRRHRSWRTATRVERWLAAVLAGAGVVAVAHLGFDVVLSAAVILSMVASLEWDSDGHHSAFTLVALSGVAALGCLVKFSDAPWYVLFLVCAAVTEVVKQPPRRRRHAALTLPAMTLTAFVGATGLLWIAAGDSLASYPSYLSNSFQFIVGYDGGLARQAAASYVGAGLALAVVLAALLVWASLASWREDRDSRVHTLCLAVVIVGFAFLNWKEGFVRQDTPVAHQLYGLYSLLFAIVVLVLASPLRAPRRAGLWAGAAALGVTIVLVPGLFTPISEARGATNAWELMDRALLPGRNHAAVTASLARLRQAYQLPALMRAAIGARGVVVMPWNLSLGPAYALHEVDLPVPQIYAAYTPVLDRIDASFLARRRVPFVLFSFIDMNGRYPLWSAPTTYDTLLRDYAVVRHSSAYTLLRWDPSAVARTLLATTPARVNHPVEVPACRDGMTTARLHLTLSAKGQLENLVYQVAPIQVSLSTDSGREGPFRLVWSNAGDGLLVSNYFSSTASLPRFGRPDAVDPAIHSMTVIDHAANFAPRFTVAFYCHVVR